MKIQWFGHSCFLIESSSGRKVLTDPYDESLDYRPPSVGVDEVIVSHDHFDHNAVHRVKGEPTVVTEPGEAGVKGFGTFHDKSEGEQRGENTVFIFDLSEITFAHLGDLGHRLSREEIHRLEDADILFVPTGGYYTIGPKEAYQVVREIDSWKIVIPMHFKTDKLPEDDFPLAEVDEFCSYFPESSVKYLDSSQHEFSKLPAKKQVWVFEYTK